jgi:uncharacterized protein YndB with AHSA1/START domain
VAARYQFLDRWLVPAPIEDVYDIVGDMKAYPTWWGDAFLTASGDDGPPRPGRRNDVVARGFLPYCVRWGAEIVEAERPRRIHTRLHGDFEGEGTWLLEESEGGTRAVLDWRPEVTKPLVRRLTPVLRPLFRANHAWAMRRGQKAIVPYAARRCSTA